MAIRQPDRTVLRWIALVTALTPALALTVVLSLFLAGGNLALMGPFVLQQSWPIVYAIHALLAAAVMYVVTRFVAPWLDAKTLLALVLAACVAELVVLLIIHPVLSNELTATSTAYLWLLATGGPLQPVAAYVGGLLALVQRQRRTNPSPSGSRGSTTNVE